MKKKSLKGCVTQVKGFMQRKLAKAISDTLYVSCVGGELARPFPGLHELTSFSVGASKNSLGF